MSRLLRAICAMKTFASFAGTDFPDGSWSYMVHHTCMGKELKNDQNRKTGKYQIRTATRTSRIFGKNNASRIFGKNISALKMSALLLLLRTCAVETMIALDLISGEYRSEKAGLICFIAVDKSEIWLGNTNDLAY